ncbi:P-loop containing nucleoside triphosphate hydrolase protein, partial [Jimgerdemannia flammicorona]
MHTPVLLILYGHPQDTERVGSVLAEGLKYLKEPPFFNPECRYQNPHIAISSIPRSMRYLPFDASYPGSRGQSQTHRDISLLLDSIPSEVDATGVGGSDDLPIGEGKIDGLNIELMRHQIQGVAWMRDREVNQNLVAEGVRTIQTLALIVTDRATAEKPHRRTTLIVCPLALIRQWESELMGKAGQNIIKVYVHHGLGRKKGPLTPNSTLADPAELLKYDVVITTYQVVASEYPESKTRGRGKKKRQDEVSAGAEPNGRGRKGRGGPQPVQLHSGNGVHQSMVIEVDDGAGGEESGSGSGMESRANSPPMSNSNGSANADGSETQFSAAAGFGPLFRKRWCLTGTPLQNNVDELFSLIHFLRIKPFCDIQKFREQISKPMQSGQSDIALGRLKALLRAMMLRRTKHILKQNHTRMMMESRN